MIGAHDAVLFIWLIVLDVSARASQKGSKKFADAVAPDIHLTLRLLHLVVNISSIIEHSHIHHSRGLRKLL
jgi:hypothetical protein